MKKLIKIYAFVGMVIGYIPLCNGGFLLKKFTEDEKKAIPLGISFVHEKQEVLKHAQEEYQILSKEHADKEIEDKNALERIDKAIKQAENQEVTSDQEEFLTNKISILNEIHQAILNVTFARKFELSILEKHMSLLQDYIKDPDFKSTAIDVKSFYTITDLQAASKRVLDQEGVIKHFTAQKSDAVSDLENKKRKLTALEKEYKDKKKEQEEFASKTLVPNEEEPQDLSFKQRGQIIDLELELTEWNKKLAQQNVKSARAEMSLLETSIFIEVEKLNKFKENFTKVRSALRIDDNDIQQSKDQVEKEKRKSLAERESYYKQINQLSAQRDVLIRELEVIGKKYEISVGDIRESAEWDFVGKHDKDVKQYVEVSYRAQQIMLIDMQIELLRAKIDFSTGEFVRLERKHEILLSWYKLIQRRYKDNEQLVTEIKKYKETLSESERNISSLTEKRSAETEALTVYNNALTNLKAVKKNITEGEAGTTPDPNNQGMKVALDYINQSEEMINEIIEINGKLIDLNSQRITAVASSLKDIQGIIAELETKSMWQRSAGAITWKGITHIIPDINYFIADLKALGSSFFAHTSWKKIVAVITSWFTDVKSFLFILLCIVLYFVLLSFFTYRTDAIVTYLLEGKHAYGGLAFFGRILAVIIGFIATSFTGIYIWSLLLFLIYAGFVVDLFPCIMFYLGSIIYLSYLVPHFVEYVTQKNRECDYALFNSSFERRFSWVFSIFAYVSIVLLLFREAFILATLHTSELPDILLAFYSIITRTLVIFSIGKDEVLGIIPTRPAWWQFVSRFVESYYYLLIGVIIVVMILSDPNVGGYGNLVSYFMWGIIETVIFFWALHVFQIYLKQLSSTIFFTKDEESLRDRFTNAKTWYGLFTISSFIVLGIFALFFVAKIWQITTIFDRMTTLIDYKLWPTGVDPSGNYIWFTPFKFLVLVGFIITGFIVAAAIEKFVLQRIFNLLFIDPGIQNTVSSITRYVTILLFILIGFLWASLNNILIAFGVVIAAVGWMVKEPLSDFVSYFIILVQRPVQIGDLITINDDIQGVVRQITPRSVILRRKDSYTIIVPNSSFITQPVNNWSYAKNFIAFDDITFTVPYTADPEKVKSLLAQVLDQNINILKSPKPVIRLDQFGDYGFVFMVRGFVTSKNVLHKWDIASEIRFNITKILRANGIKIAVPTRSIILHKKDDIHEDIDISNLLK